MRNRSPVPVGGLVSDSGNGAPVAFTATIGWVTNVIGVSPSFYSHTPGTLTLWGQFTETAGTAVAAFTITLPAGFITSATAVMVGQLANTGNAISALISSVSGSTITGLSPVTGVIGTWYWHAIVLVTT